MKKKLSKVTINIGNKLVVFFRKPITKIIITSIIILFVVFYFVLNFKDLSQTLQEIQIDILLISTALIFALATVFIGVLTWWLMLSWLGFRRDFFRISKGYSLSSLAKYIPGFIWQYASRSIFLDGTAIPLKFIGIAIISEYFLVTLLGGILSFLTFWFTRFPVIHLNMFQTILAISALLVFFIVIIFFPKLLIWIIRKFRKSTIKTENNYYYKAVIINFIGWILLGLSYFLLLKSIGIEDIPLIDAVFLHSTNFFIGNLSIPIPNGLIVREAILVFLGKPFAGEQIFIISSVIFRLMILIAEGLIALFFSLTIKTRKENHHY